MIANDMSRPLPLVYFLKSTYTAPPPPSQFLAEVYAIT